MSSSGRAYFAFAVVCVVWGTTYLAIRIALETIPPMFMASMRWIAAGGMLIVALKISGQRLPGPRSWPALTVLGILLLGFGNGAVVWAEQTVPSGLTAVLVATVPFWMVGVETLAGRGNRERLGARRIIGLVIGFIGIVMLVWPELRLEGMGSGFLSGVISSQLAGVGWAIGSTYARRRGHTDARGRERAGHGGVRNAVRWCRASTRRVSRWASSRVLSFNTRTSLALAHLIVFGAIAGFTAYAYALKHLPVATVSLYAYVNPVIAVVLGALILDEPFGLRMVSSAAVVLGGIALVRD